MRIFSAVVAAVAVLLLADVSLAMAQPDRLLVFFGSDEMSLSRDSDKTLVLVAARYRQTGATTVQLIGHSDRSGSDAANRRLSRQRADVVRAGLELRGVPAAAISVIARGERDLLIETADGVMEPQNRNVEIVLGYAAPQSLPGSRR